MFRSRSRAPWLSVLGGAAVAAVVAIGDGGCGGSAGEASACEDAAALASECLGIEVETPTACGGAQLAEAEQLLQRGCEGFDPGKADDLNPGGPYGGDLASGAREGDPGYAAEVFAGDPEGTQHEREATLAIEEEFFERSADKVTEIQDLVACDASGGDWEAAWCSDDDGDELELPVYDADVPLAGQSSGPRAAKCEQLGGTWTPAQCAGAVTREPLKRGFHNKSHLCSRAAFKVFTDEEMRALLPEGDEELASAVRVGGVFGRAGNVFGSWVRISSGHPAWQDDGQPDFRGFALKLLGVEGAQVLAGDEGFTVGDTQDFMMLSNPMMAAPDGHTFMHFVDNAAPPAGDLSAGLYVKRLAAPERILGVSVNRFFDAPAFEGHMLGTGDVLQHMSNFLAHRVFLADPIGFIRSRPKGLESQPFFSGSAIRFGSETIARYSIVPCTNAAPSLECEVPDERQRVDRSLRGTLHDRLSDGELGETGKGLRYRFFVQLHDEHSGTPLENASNEWTPEESTPVPVADIIIPPRSGAYASEAGEAENFCEALRFMPFHALTEYEPVGSINRIRKFVYRASQNHRDGQTEEDSADVCFGADCEFVSLVEAYDE